MFAHSTKERALELIREGEAKAKVARDLGVNVRTIAKWAKAAGLVTPAATDPNRDPVRGGWVKGVSGNPLGTSADLQKARTLAHKNAAEALRKLQAHADRLEKWLDEERDPSMGQTMTASELTKIYKALAAPALAPDKSTVEVQHSGEVAHAHRVTVEPIAVGDALDILAGLGLAPTAPAPAAVGQTPSPPQAARGPAV
jgi:transposase-like protein